MDQTPSSARQPAPPPVRALDGFARLAAGILGSVGLLWGIAHAIGRSAEASGATPGLIRGTLEGLAIVLAGGLAGRTATVASALAEATVTARIDRRARSEQTLTDLATRTVAALERLADTLERPPTAEVPPAPSDLDRRRLLAEIDQAIRSGRHAEAASSLDDLIARSPDDPFLLDLRERLDAARRQEWEGSLAQIQAARQVNDPARVLELYRGLEPSLELDRHGELERELSRWFLDLIHRRLRGGRIQPDVVELATVVAETFAATVEGASLRASLPTLRRSVGLCPRCARPYAGLAAACPQCLSGTPQDAGTSGADEGPDPDDLHLEPGPPPGDARDDGWMFYDEDDRDDPVPPA